MKRVELYKFKLSYNHVNNFALSFAVQSAQLIEFQVLDPKEERIRLSETSYTIV